MSLSKTTAALTLAMTLATSTSAWAFTGVGGCSGLPEYYRALGALQGNMESACAMSVAQARSILRSYGDPAGLSPQVTPASHAHSGHHHAPKPLS